MIRHIVFLKKAGENPNTISDISLELARRLRALKSKIEEIQTMEVGVNISTSNTAYHISLVTTFNNEDDLNTYRFHTEHLLVIDYIKNNNFESTVVDYNL